MQIQSHEKNPMLPGKRTEWQTLRHALDLEIGGHWNEVNALLLE
jgi:hypothetical protein